MTNTGVEESEPMSQDARPEQENGDGVDCWGCGDPITDTRPALYRDGDGFTYHNLGCAGVPSYEYAVTVWAADQAQADQVVGERLGPDEDYGFDYQVDYRRSR